MNEVNNTSLLGKVKVWRYMDISKFLYLIQTRCLYFTRVDMLGDLFEGSTPQRNKQFFEGLSSEKIKSWGFEPARFNEIYNKEVPLFKERLVKEMFISCWHMNDHESNSMWKIYGNNNGICIQSTFEKLSSTFQKIKIDLPGEVNTMYRIGEVQYIDYNQDSISQQNFFEQFMHKREFFKEEREIRAIICYMNNEDDLIGLNAPIELNELIENIYIHPQSPKWVYEIISNVTKQYELDISLVQSPLSKSPIY